MIILFTENNSTLSLIKLNIVYVNFVSEPQKLNLFLVIVIDSVSHHIYTLLFLGIQSV